MSRADQQRRYRERHKDAVRKRARHDNALYRQRNRQRYIGVAYNCARRWFSLFLENYHEDVRQECIRIALSGSDFGLKKFRRYACQQLRISAKNYGWDKSNSSPLYRIEIPAG